MQTWLVSVSTKFGDSDWTVEHRRKDEGIAKFKRGAWKCRGYQSSWMGYGDGKRDLLAVVLKTEDHGGFGDGQ
jgi:hypothetical protein